MSSFILRARSKSGIADGGAPAGASRRKGVIRRFLDSWLSVVGLVLVGSVLLFSFVIPEVTGMEPNRVSIPDRLSTPSWEHPMGTDTLGRDMLARVAYGGRVSLAVGMAGVFVAMIVGSLLGLICGYFGGPVDMLLMRIVDLIMAFPGMLLAIIVTAILGVGLWVVIIAICLFQVPNFARLVRGVVLTIKEREYVVASVALGAKPGHVIFRQILPNLTGFIVVQMSLNCAWGILSVASMSFLGFGAQPPTPELGAMVNDGRALLRQAPYISAFPGLVITLTVLGMNFIGDGLRDAFDMKIA